MSMPAVGKTPHTSAAVSALEPVAPGQAAVSKARQRLRVLVAEDNELNAQLMTFVLTDLLGCDIELARNGAEAIEALRRQTFDVILMDVQMPVMGGIEATQRIHQEWPTASRPCIIALTACMGSEEEMACRAAGMDDFLGKPLDRDKLSIALARCPRLPG